MKVLTEWFPTTIPPARPGVYLLRLNWVRFTGGTLFRWNGYRWEWLDGTVYEMVEHRGYEWRGLAFDPEAAIKYWSDIKHDAWIVGWCRDE